MHDSPTRGSESVGKGWRCVGANRLAGGSTVTLRAEVTYGHVLTQNVEE
jgi:hypothetical protein